MIYESENWHWVDLPQFESGDTFINCYFTRFEPHTPIFEGLTGISCLGCGLINCDLPPDSEIDFRCNTSQNVYEFEEWEESELIVEELAE